MNLPVGYLIGLGSNIAPAQNMPAMLAGLLDIHPRLMVSRIVRTAPKGIDSPHDFLNAVVFLPVDMPADELKQRTNAIEAKLGRDRSRPDKKLIDRTADIDLLLRTEPGQRDERLDQIESYLLLRAKEMFDYIAGRPTPAVTPATQIETVMLDGCTLGQTPATIDRDDRTGLIRVIEQR